MENYLKASLIYARVLQLYYHYCHNLVSGENFHSDHSFFESNYKQLDGQYDELSEYFISLFGNSRFNTKKISKLIVDQLDGIEVETMTAMEMYKQALKMEAEFVKYLTKLNKEAGLGLQNTIQGFVSNSDVRVYKIQQRLKDK